VAAATGTADDSLWVFFSLVVRLANSVVKVKVKVKMKIWLAASDVLKVRR
jgi:hypothetical protein